MIRNYLYTTLLLFLVSGIFAQGKLSPDAQYIRKNYTKTETYITMRDGVKLFTSIYAPKSKKEKFPMIMTRTPYSVAPYGPDNYPARLELYMDLVREGYIFVFQDVRGRYMSEGNFMDIRPHNPNKKGAQDIDESSDSYDTIDWLVKNVPNNNGRVGVYGISYPGFYSTMTLPDAHPALKAVSPQAPVTDWFIGDDFHHGGALFLLDGFRFMSGFGRPRPKPTTENAAGFTFPNQDNYQFFLDLGPVRNVKAKYFADSIHFWNLMMEHPNYDAFWQARNPRPHLHDIKPAVMTVGGWFDAEDCFGALRTYEAIEKQNPASTSNRLVMGPWYHGQWARDEGSQMGNVHWFAPTGDYYQREMELKFFNFYLKDKGTMDLPEASIFVTGSNTWKGFDAWPPRQATDMSLYFQPQGGLSWSAPKVASSFDEYISDPNRPVPYTEDVHLGRTREYMTDDQRFASRRPDVMVYATEVLTEDVTLAGPVDAALFVSTTGTDADYVVKLIDVFPDDLRDYPGNAKEVPMAGYQMLVRGEILRGRFRNSFEHPEPFIPNQVTEVSVQLPDVAHTFKKGHRIMIQVQNSWFPLADRNPQKFVDIYHCGPEDFQQATHRIFHDSFRPSQVRVKVLK
ncbi:MAG: CocE/NonD family hydrolase [Lewinellaceae bacterium]|nr:CocE/NonD family hydrolase [Lewinellaceae bacterium]